MAASSEPDFFARGYRDQAAYITRRIQETIDRILAESPEPPIIIVQSDHGSELNLDMESVQQYGPARADEHPECLLLPRRPVRGALPGHLPGQLVPRGLQHVLRRELPLLPDRSFFSTWRDPYQFIDVTDSVHCRRSRRVETSPAAGRADSARFLKPGWSGGTIICERDRATQTAPVSAHRPDPSSRKSLRRDRTMDLSVTCVPHGWRGMAVLLGVALGTGSIALRRRDPHVSPRRGPDPPEELPGMPSPRPGRTVLAARLRAGAEARRRHRGRDRAAHHAPLARLDDRRGAVPRCTRVE